MQRTQLIVDTEVASTAWFGPKKPGDVVWVTPEAARHLVENGICRFPKVEVDPSKPITTAQLPLRHADGFPIDRFAVVEKAWAGETVVCIAGGPSLTQAQLATVEAAQREGRSKVAVVNDQYLVAPWADLLYFADARWWEWHHNGVVAKSWGWAKFSTAEVQQALRDFRGQKVTIGDTGRMVADPNVFMLHNETSASGNTGGLSERPNAIRTGTNSGFQVINVVTLAGAKRIALLGYDMRYHNGRSHSHNGHPLTQPEADYIGFAKKFSTMLPALEKLGITVVNCTPGSAIDAFQRGDIASVLAAA